MLDLVSVMVFGEVTIATGVCVALVRVTTCGVFWSPSFATAAGGEGLWTIGDGGGAIGLRRSSRTASCVAARAKLSATASLSTRPAMRNARRSLLFCKSSLLTVFAVTRKRAGADQGPEQDSTQ